MNKVFSSVAGNNPGLNRFDLSYTNILSANIGTLYPVQVDEVTPGDVFKMSAFCHCEVQPMVAPLMSDLTIYAHTFFVPNRILYGVDHEDGVSIWEKFITGGKDGDYDTALPSWNPSFDTTGFSSGTIWDYIGNPVAYTLGVDTKYHWTPIIPSGVDVSVLPRLAYNRIYNDFYRDENLVDEVADTNEFLLNVAFKKDYFTSALEFQQRGETPALPVDVNLSGTIPVSVSGGVVTSTLGLGSPIQNISTSGHAASLNLPSGVNFARLGSNVNASALETDLTKYVSLTDGFQLNRSYDGNARVIGPGTFTFQEGSQFSGIRAIPLELNTTQTPISASASASDLSASATTFDIADLRLAFSIQRLQELSMRAGYRYTEFLSSHYGVSPTDARLDRPEYIGGCMIPINVSPAIQSSSTDGTSAQGNKVGIANANSIQKIGNYRVLEHGVIMTLISIRPKPIYQQGINRQWLRQTRFDYYFPEFAYLSEQGVLNAELYVDPTDSKDSEIFGYQAHWNEMRCKNNMVSGAVREQFDYWALARKFGSRPALNEDFITVRDSEFNGAFAVQDEDEFIISWSNLIDAYRPLPASGIPGLVDHVYGEVYHG